MSKVLIENLDKRDYVGHFRAASNSDKVLGDLKTVTLRANAVTKVDSDVWDHLIRVNNGINTIKNKVDQGRINIIGAGGGEIGKENQHAAASREILYTKFVNLYKEVKNLGGSENKDLAVFLDRNEIPSLKMVQFNLGNEINGETLQSFKSRLIQEINVGMHEKSTIIPGAKLESKATLVTENDPEEVASNPYPDLLEKLEELLEDIDPSELKEDGMPKAGTLKMAGMNLSKDEREYLFSLFKEKHDSEQIEPDEED